MSETSNEKKKKITKRLIIPLYLLAVIVLIFVVYGFPTITGALKETMMIEYGNLRISSQATVYIIKNETVYFANEEGKLGYYFDEGTVARGGATALTIEPAEVAALSSTGVFRAHAEPFVSGSTLLDTDSSSYDKVLSDLVNQRNESDNPALRTEIDRYITRLSDINNGTAAGMEGELSSLGVVPDAYITQKPGIISYALDGYESELSPYTMTLLDRAKMETVEAQVSDVSRETTKYGEPVFKLIDNSVWYALVWISEGDLGKYAEGASVSLRLPEGDVEGSVYKILENEGDIMVIMKFDTYYKSLASLRKIQTEIISSDYSGLIIENSFITNQDGQIGVYVVSITGEKVFVPIRVKATDGQYSLVESGFYYVYNPETGVSERFETVEVYDEIIQP